MSMADIFEFFLTQIIVFGPFMLGGILFLAAAGLPLPATIIVLASGAFCRQGLLDCRSAFIFALVGAMGGGSVGFFIGRLAKNWINRRFGDTVSWRTALAYFQKGGSLAVFFTRWLVTPLTFPINLISGGGGLKYPRYFLADFLGEVLWLLVYGGLGFVLGGNWELVSGLIGDLGGFLAGLALVLIGVFLFKKWLSSSRRERLLRKAENSR